MHNSKDGCTFLLNIFAPTPKITLKPHFGVPFSAKAITERALHRPKSHANGTTKVKVYSYMGIHMYLGVCQNFSARRRQGGANLEPPNVWEISGARKLNLKIPLDMVKYPFWVQKNYYII